MFRAISVDEKLETYLHITNLFLQDSDPVLAETYINRASNFIHDTRSPQLSLQYKVIDGLQGSLSLSLSLSLASCIYGYSFPFLLNKS